MSVTHNITYAPQHYQRYTAQSITQQSAVARVCAFPKVRFEKQKKKKKTQQTRPHEHIPHHRCLVPVLFTQDLSGGNILLTSSSINPHGFQAKVGDFGLSREANASARLAGNVYGTITHMAPEVMLHANMGPVSLYTPF